MKNYTKCKFAQKFFWLIPFALVVILGLALPSPKPALAQSAGLPEYVVQPGDTLYDIAIQFNTSIDAIMVANGFTDSDILSIGEHVKIPGMEGISGLLVTEYVPLGATLTNLSRQSQTPISTLVKLNKLISPSELLLGSPLVMFAAEDTTKMTVMPALSDGESLMEASLLTGQNPWGVAKLNSLADPNTALPADAFYMPSQNDSNGEMSLPGVDSITIDHLPLAQGSTYTFKVLSAQPVQIKANLAGEQSTFVNLGNGEQIAFGGIKALLDPGIYPLQLVITTQNGKTYNFEQYVLVASGNFITDQTLNVDPSTLEDENTKKEDAEFLDLVSQVTPFQLWTGKFQYPVAEPICIRSYFGSRRTYNNDPRIFYHTGLDLGYCGGIDVFAPAKGTVMAVRPNQIVRGNAIVIDHGLGIFTTYMHLSDISVKEGDVVKPGQLIGHIGSTGRSIGPHLHFQVDVNGTPVDPQEWLSVQFP